MGGVFLDTLNLIWVWTSDGVDVDHFVLHAVPTGDGTYAPNSDPAIVVSDPTARIYPSGADITNAHSTGHATFQVGGPGNKVRTHMTNVELWVDAVAADSTVVSSAHINLTPAGNGTTSPATSCSAGPSSP
jgi:hypothetical protein